VRWWSSKDILLVALREESGTADVALGPALSRPGRFHPSEHLRRPVCPAARAYIFPQRKNFR
jgi:hypothetical protein